MTDVMPRAERGAAAPGTPTWWATRRAAEGTRRRRGRPRRSFEQIVAAAAQLVDEIGANAFNMRLLAERLDTSTATIYRHVAGKEELMVYVVDRLLADVHPADEPEAAPARTWQEAARDVALRFHRALSEHPNVLPLLVSQVPVGPNGLAVRERTIGMLVRLGFSPGLAARGYSTIAQYVIGFAVVEPGFPGPEEAAALGDFYRALDPQMYPQTVAAADALTAIRADEEFLEGLQLMVDGIDRKRPEPVTGTPSLDAASWIHP
jgi:AcrR family transcriptional regulator